LLGFRFARREFATCPTDASKYLTKEVRTPRSGINLVGETLSVKQMAAQWKEILRLATSIKRGTVTASLILRKLGAYPTPCEIMSSSMIIRPSNHQSA
jgi:TnpA family transposase